MNMKLKLKKSFITLSFFLVIVNALFGEVSQVFVTWPDKTRDDAKINQVRPDQHLFPSA